MAIVANTQLTFSLIGNQEDVASTIYNIAPTDCPFTASVQKVSADAVLHEWQIDTLAATDTANAQLEGDDVTSFSAVVQPTRTGNRCQILNKTLVVSRTSDVIKKYGRAREYVYQLAKKTKEIKRDLEAIVTGNQGLVVGNSTTARKLRSIESWIGDNQGAFNGTNVSRGATGANASAATAGATDGTQRAFTEALLKPVIQQCWQNGGTPDTIMVGGSQKVVASTFTGNNTRFQDTSDKKLVTSIDVYVSDFGSHKIVPNRFQRARTALILDMDMWALAVLDPLKTSDLAKTGDANKGLLTWELTLESRQEAASGVVADLT
jgi:hypothetical protein